MTTETEKHVVFLALSGADYINRVVPLAAALRTRVKVTFYFDGEDESELSTAVLASGAHVGHYRPDLTLKQEPWLCLPNLIDDLRALRPSAVLYDPSSPALATVGPILGVPHVSVVPRSGPGSMPAIEMEGAAAHAATVRQWLQERYGLDTLGQPPNASRYTPALDLMLTGEALHDAATMILEDAAQPHWEMVPSAEELGHATGRVSAVESAGANQLAAEMDDFEWFTEGDGLPVQHGASSGASGDKRWCTSVCQAEERGAVELAKEMQKRMSNPFCKLQFARMFAREERLHGDPMARLLACCLEATM